MANWTTELNPFGANRAPLLTGLASDGSGPVPVAIDKATGSVLTIGGGASTVQGNLTNNNAAPGAHNIGALIGLANAAAPSYTEGDQVLLSTDLSGAMRITGSISVGGTTDNSAYTAGTSTGTTAFGFYHSTIDTVTDGRAAALAIDAKRNLHTVIYDAAGNARGVNVNASNQLSMSVDNIATGLTLSTVTAVTAITNPLPAGTNVIGHVITDANSTTAVTQATAASLNATVVGTGTFAVQASSVPAGTIASAPSNTTSTAYETSHVIKAGTGVLYGLTGYNSKTASQFIQLFNSTTVPADTAVPVVTFLVPAASPFTLDWGRYGRYFSTGIAWSNSSTGPTKTIGSADCFVDAQYV